MNSDIEKQEAATRRALLIGGKNTFDKPRVGSTQRPLDFSEEVEREVDDQESRKRVLCLLLKHLTPFQARVVVLRLGLDGQESRSTSECAEQLEVSEHSVSTTLSSALAQLRIVAKRQHKSMRERAKVC
jgi:RNA polymerase sigma factor (sigma-70 family)